MKPPEPAKTKAWVDPLRQGSTSSGVLPPRPQVAAVSGIEGTLGHAVVVDPVGFADDEARHGLDRVPGNKRRASFMESQSACPKLSERARTRARAPLRLMPCPKNGMERSSCTLMAMPRSAVDDHPGIGDVVGAELRKYGC